MKQQKNSSIIWYLRQNRQYSQREKEHYDIHIVMDKTNVLRHCFEIKKKQQQMVYFQSVWLKMNFVHTISFRPTKIDENDFYYFFLVQGHVKYLFSHKNRNVEVKIKSKNEKKKKTENLNDDAI